MTEGHYPCGHPRVPENAAKRQCRTCKAAKRREKYASDPAFAEAERVRVQSYYEAMDGIAYNRRLLQMRRVLALGRRRQRELRRAG